MMKAEPRCGLNFSCCGRTNEWWFCGLQSVENKYCTDCQEKDDASDDDFDQPSLPHHVPPVKVFLFRTPMVGVFGVPEDLTCHYLHINHHKNHCRLDSVNLMSASLAKTYSLKLFTKHDPQASLSWGLTEFHRASKTNERILLPNPSCCMRRCGSQAGDDDDDDDDDDGDDDGDDDVDDDRHLPFANW